jgi:hypothetical protein
MPLIIDAKSQSADHHLAVPRSVANLAMLTSAMLLVRRFVQVHFGLQISPI